MNKARKCDSEKKSNNRSRRKECIRKWTPPEKRAYSRWEYMDNETHKWSPDPCFERKIPEYEIEKVFRKDKTKNREESKKYNIFLTEMKISTQKPKTRKMLRSLLEGSAEEKWCQKYSNRTIRRKNKTQKCRYKYEKKYQTSTLKSYFSEKYSRNTRSKKR